MNRPLILIAVLILATFAAMSQVQAAKIYGNVYGPDLELQKNAIIKVNSTPAQSIVAADGYYSFELAKGEYEIEAFSSSQGILLYTSEVMSISAEGDYVVDLILFEAPDIEEGELNESEIVLIENLLEEQPRSNAWIAWGIIGAIIVLAVVIYLFHRKKKRKNIKKIRKTKSAKKEKIKISPDETLNRVINFIKKEKRTTQKQIRKQLEMSEAKVSLLMADLEDRGMIRKIKKGRGNVIIYNK
jgi:uncharacterized membrane protein